MVPGKVTINILNTNELHFLPECLSACLAQTYEHLEIVVIDNASRDGSPEYVATTYPADRFPQVRLLRSDHNRWFCGGHNWGLDHTDGEFALLLNTDCFPDPTFVEQLVERAHQFPRAGAIQGKIYQWKRKNPQWRVLDTVGVKMTRARRNFDRGQGQADVGQFDHQEIIFGADGVAPLYRRVALDDIRIFGEIYDEDFLIYREVVDLSWRLWRRGWSTVFAPSATARHVRNFSPKTRNRQSDFVKQLSYRNRLLTLVKNDTWETFLHDLDHILSFDLAMLGYIALKERHLIQAVRQFRDLYPKALAKRAIIQETACVPNLEVISMFDPV